MCSQVAAGDSTPALLASLDAFLAALVRLASPDALIAALRWALSLREASLQARKRSLFPCSAIEAKALCQKLATLSAACS